MARVHVYPPDEGSALQMLEEARDADLLVKASGVGVLDAFLEQSVLSFRRPSGLVRFGTWMLPPPWSAWLTILTIRSFL
jgi:hypothetical protein